MKCIFIKDGEDQCRANAQKDSSYCFTHDPNKKEERALAVRTGGLAPKKVLLNFQEEVTLDNAKDAKFLLAKIINGVWQGSIPATPIANTLGFLIRCFLDAQDKADIESRLNEIEERLQKD
jgi:hypothetical protein